MEELERQILDQLHEKRGAWPFCGYDKNIQGVAVHPVTWHKLVALLDDQLLDQKTFTLNGYDVVQTRNVPEGSLRLVPSAHVSYPGAEHGTPCPWPAFSITKPRHGSERRFQPGTTVDSSGRLQERSEYLDPAFDHQNSHKLAKR